MNNSHLVGLCKDYVGGGIGRGFVNHERLSGISIHVRLVLASVNKTAYSNIIWDLMFHQL